MINDEENEREGEGWRMERGGRLEEGERVEGMKKRRWSLVGEGGSIE